MPGKNLTRLEAEERSSLVDVDSYGVELDLTTSETTFATTSTIRFRASEGASTFVDFLGTSVDAVTLNGTQVQPAYDGTRIAVEGLAEVNELRIEATGTYMNTGEGLHRFVDPVDDEVYLLSLIHI